VLPKRKLASNHLLQETGMQEGLEKRVLDGMANLVNPTFSKAADGFHTRR
jgi:hypothetical protein